MRRLGRIACGAEHGAPTAPDTGTLLVSLTDADGDFVGYSVDVLSVSLQRPRRRHHIAVLFAPN